MKTFRRSAEFGAVVAFAAVLVLEANGAPRPTLPPPSSEQIETAVDFAERQAQQVNGALR